MELGLKSEIEAQKQTIVNLGNEVTACMGRESEAKADVAEMKQVVKDIEEELRKGETLRRKLFNQVQELKGRSGEEMGKSDRMLMISDASQAISEYLPESDLLLVSM